MMFKQTAEFIERQKPRNNVQEIVEDVLLKRRLQRSEAAWKVLHFLFSLRSQMCSLIYF